MVGLGVGGWEGLFDGWGLVMAAVVLGLWQQHIGMLKRAPDSVRCSVRRLQATSPGENEAQPLRSYPQHGHSRLPTLSQYFARSTLTNPKNPYLARIWFTAKMRDYMLYSVTSSGVKCGRIPAKTK